MARNVEAGIDYFPLNTDIIHNPKVKLVVAEFGPKAWAVLLPLYCKIYREKGYWIDWYDEDSKLLFAQDECKIDLTTVREIVNGCIRRSLFDKGVFDMFGVLTSDRIQENYLEATKRRQTIDLIREFIVIDNIENKNVNIIPLNVNIITKNVDTGTQNKIKEIKLKEIKGGAGEKKEQEQVSIIYPFGEKFRTHWEKWKDYKKIEHRFTYKTAQSEQAAINELVNIAGGVEDACVQIIHQSIAQGWKGLFHLKKSFNGNSQVAKQPTGADVSMSGIAQKLAAMPNR